MWSDLGYDGLIAFWLVFSVGVLAFQMFVSFIWPFPGLELRERDMWGVNTRTI